MQDTPLFIHLRTKSSYSILKSALSIDSLLQLCLEHKMPALGLTDENSLFGALEFSSKLVENGIQPIHGCGFSICLTPPDPQSALNHTRIDTDGEIVLIAQNEQGYQRLMALSSKAYLQSEYNDFIWLSFEDVLKETSGLIALTGGAEGILNRLILKNKTKQAKSVLKALQASYREGLYIELQRYGIEEEQKTEPLLIEWANEYALPLVATNNAVYRDKSMYQAYDALLAISESSYLSVEDRKKSTPEHYFKTGSEMVELFKDLPECITNTVLIARKCHFWTEGRDPILPGFPCFDNRSEDEELEEQALKGLKSRLHSYDAAEAKKAYFDRLKIELSIIKKMGFSGYFLIVSDFVKWAKLKGIPVGPGRGSGAGSVVAWALSITNLDPLRFGLLFERFLNPERVSMPDFDIDFCQEKRDLVIEYVREKYGSDRVAHIITFGTLQPRAVVRDVGRVMQLPLGLVDRLAKMIPNNPADPTNLKQALKIEPRLKQAVNSDSDIQYMLDIALKLEGLYRNASTHAAGVVIADRNLTELIPLYKDSRSSLPATQFSMKYTEKAGLVKFDFLGLKTLTVIDRCLKYLKNRKINIDLDCLPLDDRASYEMLGEGNSIGVFQLESTGMRDTLKKMKPDSLEDLIALISLYRPGPMKNIDLYIDRKFGREEADYLHPDLEPILKETYGVIIYQEQVMRIAQILSGYSLGEADLLRRAMGKKQKEEMTKQKSRFIKGAEKKGVSSQRADFIFELVLEFAGYGFNKSHAAAYALIAYQTAYLKANYPVEFMAALMSLELNNTDKLSEFIHEARKMDIEIIPPNINRCFADFEIDNGSILYALGALRNVSISAMETICDLRKKDGIFHSMIEFAERVDSKLLNKRTVENLSRAGAFDSLGVHRWDVFHATELICQISVTAREEKQSSQENLFGQKFRLELPKSKPWSLSKQLDEEFLAIGSYLSGHPMDNIFELLKEKQFISCFDALTYANRQDTNLRLAGVLRKKQERISKKTGQKFAFLILSDPTGEFDIYISPDLLKKRREIMETGAQLALYVRVDYNDGDIRFFAEQINPLGEILSANNGCFLFHINQIAGLEALSEYKKEQEQQKKSSKGEWRVRLTLSDLDVIAELSLGDDFPTNYESFLYFKQHSFINEIKVL